MAVAGHGDTTLALALQFSNQTSPSSTSLRSATCRVTLFRLPRRTSLEFLNAEFTSALQTRGHHTYRPYYSSISTIYPSIILLRQGSIQLCTDVISTRDLRGEDNGGQLSK